MTVEGPGEAKRITVGARQAGGYSEGAGRRDPRSADAAGPAPAGEVGKSRFNLQTLAAEDFPRLALTEAASTTFSVCQKLLRLAPGLVQYAMAQQDIRYYLNGLLMDGRGRAAQAGSHRRAPPRLRQPQDRRQSLARQEVILPRKTIIELSKLLDESDDPVVIDLSASQARFKFGNVVLVSSWSTGSSRLRARDPAEQPKKLKARSHRAAAGAAASGDPDQRQVSRSGGGCSATAAEDQAATIPSRRRRRGAGYSLQRRCAGHRVQRRLPVDVLNNLDVAEVECGLGDANSSARSHARAATTSSTFVMPMRI